MGKSKMGRSMSWGTSGMRAGAMALSLSVAAVGLSTSGCRVTEEDVSSWARKASGPRKLVAVLQHDKYDLDLRVKAAMTLVTMKPRGGRAVGLLGSDEYIGLLDGLSELSVTERTQLINGMVPELVAGIATVPQGDEADTSIPYKDAAYALLTYENDGLVADPHTREALTNALVDWAQQNFVARIDDTSQLYGMEQVLRYVRAQGVRGLTGLIEPEFKKIRELAGLIHELGDPATKLEASQRLVKVAEFVDSKAWIEQKAPAVEAANKRSGLTVKANQFEKQLEAYQEEELLRVFGAMKSVGQKPIVDYLLAYAQNDKNPEKRRAAALAGLENNLDRKNQAHARAMLDLLASDETPDSIRDVAVRRVGELSREQVAERLYAMFEAKRWRVRATVASLLLRMTTKKDLAEFMGKLGEVKHMAISEPLTYGPLLKNVAGSDIEEVVQKYADPEQPVPVRLTALSHYYANGTKADLAKVERYKEDSEKTPSCESDAEQCAWTCTVEGEKGAESKDVKTIGQFVEYCLIPAMSKRDPDDATTDGAADDQTKDDKTESP